MNHNKMTNISAKRGFLWPSFEIYSGVSGFTDYGPLGASLKNNIMQKWRKQYVSGEGFYEIEGPTVMPKEVLKASGHVDNFTDPMCKCEKCGEVFRADHIIEEVIGEDVESLENEELDQIVIDNNIVCPECGGKLSNIWNYNLMFKTEIGAKGDKVGYMRPETAQGIFILFKRLERFFRGKLPFGVVQLGKAYRNEISPRQGVIRLREFTQAEAEIFLNPKDKTHPKFAQIENEVLRLNSQEVQENDLEPLEITAREALEKGIVANEMLIYQLYLARKFLTEIGIPEDDLNVFMEYDEPKKEQKTVVKPNLSKFGPIFKGDSPKVKQAIEDANPEDIKAALESDGKFTVELDKVYEVDEELLIFEDVEEEITGEKVIPHVIEPSFGIDRILYSVLLHSFTETEEKDYFKFAKSVAPVQIGVFPLVNKEGPREIAQELTENLRMAGFRVEYDAAGTIGRRYARADEIGIPLAVTVDFDTLEDNQVTVRDRDTEAQERIAVGELTDYLEKYYK